MGRPAVLALLSAVATATAPATAPAVVLEVRAGSRLEAWMEETDAGPVVYGRLVTDRGEPVGGARLQVTVGGVSQETQTDPDGTFAVPTPTVADATAVRLDYAGASRYEPAALENTLRPTLARVTLDLRAPARASLDAPTLDVEVVGHSAAGFASQKITVRRAGGATLAEGYTADDGRVPIRLATSRLGAPGPAILEATFEPTDRVRASATSRAEILLTLATYVWADATPRRVRAEGSTRVFGRVTSRRGPITGGAVAVRRGDALVGAARTDASGRFTVDVAFEDESPARLDLRAVYEPDASYRAPAVSAPMAVELLAPRTVPLWPVLASALAALAVSGLLLSRLRPPRRRPPRPAPPPVLLAGAVPRKPARRGTARADVEITGRVWDPVARRAVTEATITVDAGDTHETLTSDADGAFTTGALPPGAVHIHIAAPAYEDASLHARLPHAGELRGFRFVLVPLRQRLAELYRDTVAPLAPRRAWGFATPRELADVASAETRAGGDTARAEAVSTLRDLYEVRYYGRAAPDRDALGHARAVAASVGTAADRRR